MTQDALRFLIPAAPTVALRLNGPLTERVFTAMLSEFASVGQLESPVPWQQYWAALEQRRTGASRWDAVAPAPPPRLPAGTPPTTEHTLATGRAWQSVRNILAYRTYQGYRIGPLLATLDWFNPADELELGYEGAGELVLALIVTGVEGPLVVHENLVTVPEFYTLLEKLDRLLNPDRICGAGSLATPLMGYLDGRIDRTKSPWTYLYPLSVIPREPSIPKDSDLSKAFALVRPWSQNRVLLQPLSGLSLALDEKFVKCARLVGRIAVQETLSSGGRKRSVS